LTVCSSLCLASLFHPTSTHGVHPPKLSPFTQPVRLSTSLALLPLPPRLSPICSAAFRALLRVKVRWPSVMFPSTKQPRYSHGLFPSGFSHSLPWPTFQLASSRLSAPPLPQTVGLFLLWLSFLPGAVSVVAKHRIFSLALLLRVSTNKEFGLSLSRTADPPEVFGLLLPHHPKTTRNRFSPGQSR